MLTTLQPEPGKMWCGPSAVSILTGVPYRDVLECVGRDRTGIWTEEAILALNQWGFTAIPVDLTARYDRCPTLERYLRERPFAERGEPLLVTLYKHLITVHMDWAADNWTKRPVPIDEFPKLRRRVEEVHIIRRRNT